MQVASAGAGAEAPPRTPDAREARDDWLRGSEGPDTSGVSPAYDAEGLVVHAGSLLRAFVRLNAEELGFRTEGVWTLPLKPKGVETGSDWIRRMDLVRAALDAVPRVSMATYGMTMPLEFTGGSSCCWPAGLRFPATSIPDVSTDMHLVDADYFAPLDLEFLAGRPWSRPEGRSQSAPTVVSEQLAIQVYGSAQAALGRPFDFGQDGDEFHIAGVVANNRHYGPDQDHRPAAYAPNVAWVPDFPSSAHVRSHSIM